MGLFRKLRKLIPIARAIGGKSPPVVAAVEVFEAADAIKKAVKKKG